MGKVQFFDDNRRVELNGNIENYLNTSLTEKSMTMVYDPAALGPISERDAYRVKFIVEDGVVETIGEGPYAGAWDYTAGTLKRVNLYNEDGDLLMQVSGLNLSMVYISSMIFWNSGWNAVNHILAQGHTYYGSDVANSSNDDGDNIATGHGTDLIYAGKGNDWIQDVGGKDDYRGGAGYDFVNYNGHRWADPATTDGIVARLDKGYIDGFDGLRDKIDSIEGVQGSMFDDKFVGNGKSNEFQGLAGNDMFDGRGGRDTVRYWTDESLGGIRGVRVNLQKETVKDQWGNTDTIRNIERVGGTDTDDVMRDDTGDNWFDGEGGDDRLSFGKGEDGASGGAGADTFIFRGDTFGNDYIEDFEDGTDRIQIENAPDFAALTIVAAGTDTLIQWNGNEVYLANVSAAGITAADFIF